jgi:hypothetical protein
LSGESERGAHSPWPWWHDRAVHNGDKVFWPIGHGSV